MPNTTTANASDTPGDYTGRPPPGVRVLRALREVALIPVTLSRMAHTPKRRDWAIPAVIALFGGLLLYRSDGAVMGWVSQLSLGGDLRRELEVLGQFGAPASAVIAAYLIWRLAPPQRPRLADWGVAYGLCAFLVSLLKIAFGRPRPKFEDPQHFATVFGAYPLGEGRGVRPPWEFWTDSAADLWSMPSSHSSAAAVMAVALGVMIPRIRGAALTLAVVVGLSRILFRAHYPSDVLVGLCIGYAVGAIVMRARLGQRLLWRLAPSLRQHLLKDQPRTAAPAPPPLSHDTRIECHECGYDLTGLTTPTCPKCGAPLPPPRGEGGSEGSLPPSPPGGPG